jgi:RNA polymerase sigma factor (sigma-70 family)
VQLYLIEAYVRQAMYHQHIAWWRRRRVTEHLSDTPPLTSHEDPADAAAMRVSVAAALRRLSPRQRAVIIARYFDDLTESQTADLLDCRIGTVKRHAHEALRKLREIAPELVDDRSAEARERSPR